MARTIVALFDTADAAKLAVEDLFANGVGFDEISLVSLDTRGEYRTYASGGETKVKEAVIKEGAATGAVRGGVLGGLLGLLAGVGMLTIPGIGPVVAAGPDVATLAGAGVGAATGGLIGALVGLDIPKDQAENYAEGVRRGGTLVLVRAEDAMADRVQAILARHNPVDIKVRTAEWRQEGWKGFDPTQSSMHAKQEHR